MLTWIMFFSRDTKEVQIKSLMRFVPIDDFPEDLYISIDVGTLIRTIPFVSRFGGGLARLSFSGKSDTGEDLPRFAPAGQYFDEDDFLNYDRMFNFVDSISGAFQCGAFPDSLIVSGLCCPRSSHGDFSSTHSCETCERACKSFPLESVVLFESRASSVANARSERPYHLDVCLERTKIESIIESRPGGKELLRSKKRLLWLLSCGRHYKLTVEHPFHIVKFTANQLEEIERTLEHAELDLRKLSVQEVTSAILGSFSIRGSIPPKENRYLSEASLRYLADKIGHIDEEEFRGTDLVAHVQGIASVMRQCQETVDHVRDTEYRDIEKDCLGLIRRVLDSETPPIEKIVEAAIVPCLAEYLEVGGIFEENASNAVKNILVKGTEKHKKMVIDAGAIPSFVARLQCATNHHVVKDSLIALADVVAYGSSTPDTKTNHIKTIMTRQRRDSGSKTSIQKIIEVLDSQDDVCVDCALQILVLAEKYDPEKVAEEGLLSHVLRFLQSSRWATLVLPPNRLCMLANAVYLLRMLLSCQKSNLQHEIRIEQMTVVVPRLIHLFKTTKDQDIQTDIARAMMSLAGTMTSQGHAGTLVSESGFLSILGKLMSYSDCGVSVKAIFTVGELATTHCEQLSQAGLAESLLEILEKLSSAKSMTRSKKLFTLSSAYKKCCRSMTIDLASTKAGMKVLTKLLVTNSRESVVRNSCWSLLYLMDGLKRKGACSGPVSTAMAEGVVNIFLKNLLIVLPKTSLKTQEPLLRLLLLVTKSGDSCIRTLAQSNGISVMKSQLSSKGVVQKLACCAITNMIAGNRGLLQVAINSGVISCWIKMIAGENERDALWALYQATKCGFSAQIRCLVEQDCVHRLCDVLATEIRGSLLTVLWTLKNVSIEREYLIILFVRLTFATYLYYRY